MIEEIKSKWEEVILYMKEEYDLSDVSIRTWIQPLKPFKVEKDSAGKQVLYLIVSGFAENDNYFISMINKKYNKMLMVAIEEITGISCTVEIGREAEFKNSKAEKGNLLIQNGNKVDTGKIFSANLNPRYTFDSFVVGKSNNLAHAASLAVAESPGEIYNPLFIYGGVGLGKTHLMQSVANFILKNDENAKVLYVTSETFTNELIDAIRNKNNSTTNFRNKYRTNDVLLIDDIQFIIGKESTQEEFFHTFNALYESKKQIIISSDRPPKDLETLEDRLKSRFEQGLSVDIQSPDYETRMAILRKKEETDNINIDNEIIQYIATNIKSNIRELEGALNKIVAMGKLDNTREINLELAQEVLKDIISPNIPPQITPEIIIKVVAEHYGITVDDIKSKKRSNEIVYPRHVAMYLCRDLTDLPLKSIGERFGRDHSTVMHGLDKIKDDMKNTPELLTNIEVLKKKINPH